jgi:SAM-dependent methyltransferase
LKRKPSEFPSKVLIDCMSATNSNPTELYTLNPLNRFSDRADDYKKYRPSYPDTAIKIILNGLNPSAIVATDIGAGTGISSRLLADYGVRVLAIEPNSAMIAAATSHPLVEFRSGKAEDTQLEDASVDLVTCFQAFHWFEPKATLLEFRRILKPPSANGSVGRLALVWNNRDREDDFTNEYSKLIVAASTNSAAIHTRSDSAKPLLSSQCFTNFREFTVVNRQELDLSGLMGRVRSSSYIPQTGEVFEKLTLALEKLHDRFQNDRGFVYLSYATSIHLAEPSFTVAIAKSNEN